MFIKNQPLAEINNNSFLPADIFICSSSFEDRCKAIPDSIDPSNIRQALILKNVNIQEVQENADYLNNLFPGKASFINVSTQSCIETADYIADALVPLISNTAVSSVAIDITTFTHESLLILVNILKKFKHQDLSTTLLYTSALEYSTDKKAIEDKWLSNGVSEIRTILGYSGDVKPLNKTHLIMFVGYESSRSSKIIELLEPSVISLGYGEPGTSTNSNHEEASSYFHTVVEEMAKKHAKVYPFPFSCNNPHDVKKKIIAQSRIDENANIIIAPLNTKLSTIGVGLAALELDNIQLCYAPALQYNTDHYSRSGDSFSAFKLNF